MSSPEKVAGSLFPETRWTSVLAARDQGSASDASQQALRYLCEAYWWPVYTFARQSGKSHEDAVQGFFEYLLEKEVFGRAQPERGRFRSFLLSAFRHFMNQAHRDAHRIKRGGGIQLVPMDELSDFEMGSGGLASGVYPEAGIDRAWADTVLCRALSRLERE